MKRIYLAGPMRGLPGCNFAAFDRAAEAWRTAGWHPITPTDLDRMLGREPDPAATDFPGPETRHGLAHTAFALASCVLAADAIALLPGWERSRGATMELALAQFVGLEAYDAVTRERIQPTLCPWSAHPSPAGNGDWADVWRGSAEACIEREERRRKQDAEEILDLERYRKSLDEMPVSAPGIGHSY